MNIREKEMFCFTALIFILGLNEYFAYELIAYSEYSTEPILRNVMEIFKIYDVTIYNYCRTMKQVDLDFEENAWQNRHGNTDASTDMNQKYPGVAQFRQDLRIEIACMYTEIAEGENNITQSVTMLFVKFLSLKYSVRFANRSVATNEKPPKILKNVEKSVHQYENTHSNDTAEIAQYLASFGTASCADIFTIVQNKIHEKLKIKFVSYTPFLNITHSFTEFQRLVFEKMIEQRPFEIIEIPNEIEETLIRFFKQVLELIFGKITRIDEDTQWFEQHLWNSVPMLIKIAGSTDTSVTTNVKWMSTQNTTIYYSNVVKLIKTIELQKAIAHPAVTNHKFEEGLIGTSLVAILLTNKTEISGAVLAENTEERVTIQYEPFTK